MLKHLNTWVLVGVTTAAAMVVTGCGSKTAAPPREAAAEEKPLAVGTLTVEQVLQARCPHGPTIECAECRYEVGVVKLDPSLVTPVDGSRTGMVKTINVTRSRMTTAVNVTGEIRMNENAAVHVSPRIPGVIRSVNVDIGAELKKDDILFTVDSAELSQAISDYEKNAALAALSARTFQRHTS